MRQSWVFTFFVVVVSTSSVWSADSNLSPLSEALTQIRSTHGANKKRDAGPELTPIKHQLRSWVEGYLPPETAIEPRPRDFERLNEQLNTKLEAAGLTCGDINSTTYRCEGGPLYQDNERGYLGDVRLSSLDYGRYILAVTNVGVKCGYDESAYVYERGPDRRWKLLLQSEQDDYGVGRYTPQNFLSINVSPSNVAWNELAPPPLVLTLGFSPWCSSNWNALSTRLWRASASTTSPRPIIDREDNLYMGYDQIAAARLTQKDVLIEFQARSIDGGTLIRPHVEHYLVDKGDKLERIAPVALDPSDFVDEWLTSNWADAGRWTDRRADASVSATAHSSLKADYGEFDRPATRCRADPTLWQVGFAAEIGKDTYTLGPKSHFLVRWTAPYRFTLVRIQRRPFAHCDQVVAMPGNIGTLFPTQGWTR
jgi:hypothetical protein